MRKYIGRTAVLGVAAIATAVSLSGGAVAAPTAYAPLPLPANSVGTTQIQNGGVWGVDIHDNTIPWLKLGSQIRSEIRAAEAPVNTARITNKAVTEDKLSDAVKTKLNAVGTGQPGKSYGCDGTVVTDPANAPKCPGTPGTPGTPGAKGDKGDPGDPASDVFGKEGGDLTIQPTTIEKIGGSFSTNATKVGEFTLPKGTWLVNSSVVFDRIDEGADGYQTPTTDTYPQFALRFPGDAGTIMGNAVSKRGFVELTGSSVKTITLDADTTITAYGFGYNEDRSSFGGGQITVGGTVSAVRVG